MLIKSGSLGKVLRELGSPDKIEALEKQAGRGVRELLLQAALPVGYLRWVSLELGLQMRFRDLNFSRFVDPETLDVGVSELVKTLKDHSQRPEVDSLELVAEAERRASKGHDPWDICNGHDLIQVMSLGLRKALGSQNAASVTTEMIGQNLRLAYERHDFDQSDFYRRAKDWEAENHPYTIFS
jgi:hypothetical protein